MLLLALLFVALASPAPAAAVWRWPLRGEVLTPFHLGPNPFAPGQHRGIDIAAAAGAPVHSVCAGRVSFAGRIPRRGRAVTVLCGPLVATYLELGSVAVRRDQAVGSGAPIGTVAASHLQLGARRAGERHGYVDPLTLLGPGRSPPVGAAPSRRPPRGVTPRVPPPRGVPHRAPRLRGVPRVPAPPRGLPALAPPPRAVRRRAPESAPSSVPLPAWLGLALFAAGTPVGAVVRRRRRHAVPSRGVRTVDDRA